MARAELRLRRVGGLSAGWHMVSALLFAVALVAATLWNLSGPSIFWDEGWTLAVARNFVERGHYGRLLSGQFAPNGLEASFPVTASVALSFRLFGVGLWQGRLPGAMITLAALVVIYDLARRLYNRSVARGTLVVLLLMSPLHPLVMGRLVLAEMPMLFFLLAGYTCFLLALRRSLWFMLLAILLWSISLITKAQTLPFWATSLLVPFAVALLRRQWRLVFAFGLTLPGSLITSRLIVWLQGLLLRGHTLPGMPLEGLNGVTAYVPVLHNRVAAAQTALIFGCPMLLGLGYVTWGYLRRWREAAIATDPEDTVRLAVLMLAGSWFAWYLLLSVGWGRYLFPATFTSSIFVSALLHDLLGDPKAEALLGEHIQAYRTPRFRLQRMGPLFAMVMIAVSVFITVANLYSAYVVDSSRSSFKVADFLNTSTPASALIETYETELHFLLQRRYHYPPDQIHVELSRRTFVGEDVPIDYNPLDAKPDYLVVGSFARMWHLYDSVLATGVFHLLRHDGQYDVYERVR